MSACFSSPPRSWLSGNWLHHGCACFETRLVALLSMREVVDGITGIPRPEEAAERLSRRTHGADPANRQFPESLGSRGPSLRGTNFSSVGKTLRWLERPAARRGAGAGSST